MGAFPFVFCVCQWWHSENVRSVEFIFFPYPKIVFFLPALLRVTVSFTSSLPFKKKKLASILKLTKPNNLLLVNLLEELSHG